MTRYDEHRAALSSAADGLERTLMDADLDTTVPTCPGWTLADLGAHVTDIHRWALGELTGDRPEPLTGTTAVARFREGADELLQALAARDADAPCRAIYPPDTAATWARRQALETSVHLWDAQRALGGAPRLQAALASDGVREVFEDLYPRQVRLGRIEPVPATVVIRFSDADGEARVGGGAPDAVLTASAHDALLLLWGRVGLDGIDAIIDGDLGAVDEVLTTALVP